MPPSRASRKRKGVEAKEEKVEKADQKQSLEASTMSPAFNTRRRLRGCTIIDTPSSTSKNTISIVGGLSSLGLAKKSNDITEEPPKSEIQEINHDYGNFHSSQLNDVIDSILRGKHSKVSLPHGNYSASPSRLSPAKRCVVKDIPGSVTPVDTAVKTTPTTKADPNAEVLTSQVSNQTEGSKECNQAAPAQYMNNLKPSSTTAVPTMGINAEQTTVEEAMVASNFVKQTEIYKEFNLDATLQYINNLKQTDQAPVDCMTVAAEQTPLEEAMVESFFAKERPQGSSINDFPMKNHLSRTHSFNLTEMAAMCNDDDSSRDEVVSHTSLVTVWGYTVKEASAPLLEAIFLKYGDIAANCAIRSISRFISRLLEDVCDIMKTLQETDFLKITQEEIQSKIDYVCDLESVKMEVGWLHQRLTDILDAKQLVKQSSTMKAEKDKIMELINEKERELKCYEEKISITKELLAMAKVEADKINERHSGAKGKVRMFYKRSLVDGLL